MAVRIVSRVEAHQVVVCLAGTLDQAAGALLRGEIRQETGPLVLDLSGLWAFDEAGLTLLRELVAEGAVLQGASTYVKLRLADAGTGIRSAPPR